MNQSMAAKRPITKLKQTARCNLLPLAHGIVYSWTTAIPFLWGRWSNQPQVSKQLQANCVEMKFSTFRFLILVLQPLPLYGWVPISFFFFFGSGSVEWPKNEAEKCSLQFRQRQRPKTETEKIEDNAQKCATQNCAQLNAEQRKNSNNCSQTKIKWTLNWQQRKNKAEGLSVGLQGWRRGIFKKWCVHTHTWWSQLETSAAKSQLSAKYSTIIPKGPITILLLI